MLNTNLQSQRVSIVGNSSLFEEGLSHLLTFETNLQVSDSEYFDDISFLKDISHKKPDVILLNESSRLNLARMLDLLFSIPSLSGRRVIIVRLTNNVIDVYDFPYRTHLRRFHKQRQFIVTKPEDLIAAVQNNLVDLRPAYPKNNLLPL